MLDRQKLEAILNRRFPGAARDQVATAVNAIMGLSDEWEEVLHEDRPVPYHVSHECGAPCQPAVESDPSFEFRLFKRRDR